MNKLRCKLRVIGIAGKTYNDAHTVANYLCDRHGFTKLNLGNPMKTMEYANEYRLIRKLDDIMFNTTMLYFKFKIEELRKINPNLGIEVPNIKFQDEIRFIQEQYDGQVWKVINNSTPTVNCRRIKKVIVPTYDDINALKADGEIQILDDGVKNLYKRIEQLVHKTMHANDSK